MFKKTITFVLLLSILMLSTGCAEKSNRAKMIKHLNKKYSNYTEVPYGLDITKKVDIVSICYSTWFTRILGQGKREPKPPNITEILAGEANWGGENQFHYWGKPALGYYRSDNKDVIRQHMTWLSEAGIDFIIIDNTNAWSEWENTSDWKLYIDLPCIAILEVMQEMRSEGKETPYFVFWSGVSDEKGWRVVEKTYEKFYADDKYKDCFVYWEGKPFTLVTGIISDPPEEFTIRQMMGLNQLPKTEQWSFLNPVNVPAYDKDGFVEQMAVCTATQVSYMTEPTAFGRDHGRFFYGQWKRAFENSPKVITITWWNEWAAQRLIDEKGKSRFVDNYTQEYSRDIEPMEGGHGDLYYQWMIQYIQAYKKHKDCPRLVEDGY